MNNPNLGFHNIKSIRFGGIVAMAPHHGYARHLDIEDTDGNWWKVFLGAETRDALLVYFPAELPSAAAQEVTP